MRQTPKQAQRPVSPRTPAKPTQPPKRGNSPVKPLRRKPGTIRTPRSPK